MQLPKVKCAPRYCLFNCGDKKALYEENSMSYWIGSDESLKLVIGEAKSVSESERPIFNNYVAPEKVKAICLETTFSCNLACTYCFVRNYSAEQMKNSFLSYETAIEFIEKYADMSDLSISFFGGEPTLNMKLVYQVVEYCKTNCKKYKFHMTTNGILLTDKMAKHVSGDFGDLTIAEWMDSESFSMIVSLDGGERSHDEHRVFHGGGGSHHAVMESLAHLSKNCPNIVKKNTLRGTYTATMDEEAESLCDRIKFLNETMHNGAASHVSLEPVMLTEGCCVVDDVDISITDGSIAHLRRQYEIAIDWFIGEIKEGKSPRWHQIGAWVSRIFHKKPSCSECGAGKGYLSCTHKGDITACHRTHNSLLGNIKDGIDESVREKWLDNRFEARSGCSICSIRHICGGGCREASIGSSGDIKIPMSFECEMKLIWTECAFRIIDELTEAEINRAFGSASPSGKGKVSRRKSLDRETTKL